MCALVPDDFDQCMVSNTRMAARAVTRRYDSYLRPHGVTATQLSLLGGLCMMPGATVSEIAEVRGFDRTTLTRNLDRLEAMGLVSSTHAKRGNGRIAGVTARGDALMERLLPLWRQAQTELTAEISRDAFSASLNVLKRLAKV
jgi:DNA-binding MarR family transcriptional regulator